MEPGLGFGLKVECGQYYLCFRKRLLFFLFYCLTMISSGAYEICLLPLSQVFFKTAKFLFLQLSWAFDFQISQSLFHLLLEDFGYITWSLVSYTIMSNIFISNNSQRRWDCAWCLVDSHAQQIQLTFLLQDIGFLAKLGECFVQLRLLDENETLWRKAFEQCWSWRGSSSFSLDEAICS